MADARTSQSAGWLRPRRVLLAFVMIVLATTLLVPWSSDEDGSNLSSYSTAPGGARGLYEVVRRVGIPVDRRLVPMRDSIATAPTYVILEPAVGLTAGEVRGLLDAVRAGASLLAVVPSQSRLSDSLGVYRTAALPPRNGSGESQSDSEASARSGLVRYVLRTRATGADSTALWIVPDDATIFLETPTRRGLEPGIVGLPFGSGRIVIAADPDGFSNAVIRRGEPGVRAVRLLEWLDDGAGRTVVFDEYHHGYGEHANLIGATGTALARTPTGRVLLHASVAGFVLLLAVGVRPIRPRAQVRIERRSPLEHVGALARAYAAAHGKARATLLLVRGLRRRRGGPRGGQDEAAYLRAIGERYPDHEPDVERLIRAMHDEQNASIDDITASLHRIEQAMTQ